VTPARLPAFLFLGVGAARVQLKNRQEKARPQVRYSDVKLRYAGRSIF
jgi:hypothetical protein